MGKAIGIRIWNGPEVVQVITVSPHGSTTLGRVGGAQNSTRVDIEIDPWQGLIVDHSVTLPPVNYREEPGDF